MSLFHVECRQLRKHDIQQSAALHLHESHRRGGRQHYLVELVDDTLAADDAYAFTVAVESVEGLLVNAEIELRGETDASHHAQWVVAEGDIRVKGRADDAVLHILLSVEGVYQLTKAIGIETNSHSVDSEIATLQVVLQCAVLHNRFARVALIALPTRTDKLHLHAVPLDLRRAEVAKDAEVSTLAQLADQSCGHLDAAAYNDDINVLRRTLQEEVTHIAADEIALHSHRIGYCANAVKHRGFQGLAYFFLTEIAHYFFVSCAKVQKS